MSRAVSVRRRMAHRHPVQEAGHRLLRRRCLRRLAAGPLALLASPGAVRAMPKLPSGAADLGWNGRMRINGRDMDVRLFSVSMPPFAAAAALSQEGGERPWLLPLPDGVMVMGMQQGRMWLVQLRAAGPQASQGMAAAEIGGRPAPRAAMPAWVPAGAVLLLDAQTGEGGSRAVQQIYAHAFAAPVLSRSLEARLRGAGWHPDEAAGAGRQWRLGGRRLWTVVVARSPGSGLLAVEASAGQD